MSVLGFEWMVMRSALISGLALGALYGIVAVSLVLTYRMSRIVGFVHGGIALATAFVYWYLTANPRRTSGAGTGGWAYATREWPKIPALLLALVVAAGLGFVAGALFTGRMADWPRVTLTTCSLGAMLLLTGITASIWEGAFEIVPSPFGQGRTEVFGYFLSHHQIAVMVILVVVVGSLHLVVSRTSVGVQLRGISDDIEAAEMVGVPVRQVSLGVWTVAGALAGLSGVLLTPITRLGASTVLFVLLRSMAGAALGGFESLLLALLGAMIFGQVESHVQGGTFGSISSGWREVILMTVLSVGVLAVTRLRASRAAVREV
jgi:branched-chain amino acid transport system permease protein